MAPRIGGVERADAPAGFTNSILNHGRDQSAIHLIYEPTVIKARIFLAYFIQYIRDNWDTAQVPQLAHPSPEPIVDIVIVVGDIIGERG